MELSDEIPREYVIATGILIKYGDKLEIYNLMKALYHYQYYTH